MLSQTMAEVSILQYSSDIMHVFNQLIMNGRLVLRWAIAQVDQLMITLYRGGF